MPKNTPVATASQPSGLAALVPFALRRRLMGVALGISLSAILAAPSLSLVSAGQVQVAPYATGHSLLADGPQIWGCGGVPLPC